MRRSVLRQSNRQHSGSVWDLHLFEETQALEGLDEWLWDLLGDLPRLDGVQEFLYDRSRIRPPLEG